MNRKVDIFLFPLFGIFLGLAITAVILSSHLLQNIDPSSTLENYYLMTEEILETNNQLNQKINSLKLEHEKLTQLTVSAKDRETLDSLKNELALNEVNGSGVSLLLRSRNSFDDFNNDTVCYAAYLRDINNVLSLPEAEVKGISINGNRVSYKTTMSCMGVGIAMDFQKVIPPIEIKIVGNATKIMNILRTKKFMPLLWNDIEKGVLDMQITELEDIQLEAYSGTIKSNYIKNHVNE